MFQCHGWHRLLCLVNPVVVLAFVAFCGPTSSDWHGDPSTVVLAGVVRIVLSWPLLGVPEERHRVQLSVLHAGSAGALSPFGSRVLIWSARLVVVLPHRTTHSILPRHACLLPLCVSRRAS